MEVEILAAVLMEALFVLTKFYKLPKQEGVTNRNKLILSDALSMHVDRNIDFIYALICTKATLQGYEWISFDHDVK